MTSAAAAIDNAKHDDNPTLDGDEDEDDQELNDTNADAEANGQGNAPHSLYFDGVTLTLLFV
jgi:hypothetical protein